jgi:hypothetical protein
MGGQCRRPIPPGSAPWSGGPSISPGPSPRSPTVARYRPSPSNTTGIAPCPKTQNRPRWSSTTRSGCESAASPSFGRTEGLDPLDLDRAAGTERVLAAPDGIAGRKEHRRQQQPGSRAGAGEHGSLYRGRMTVRRGPWAPSFTGQTTRAAPAARKQPIRPVHVLSVQPSVTANRAFLRDLGRRFTTISTSRSRVFRNRARRSSENPSSRPFMRFDTLG